MFHTDYVNVQIHLYLLACSCWSKTLECLLAALSTKPAVNTQTQRPESINERMNSPSSQAHLSSIGHTIQIDKGLYRNGC